MNILLKIVLACLVVVSSAFPINNVLADDVTGVQMLATDVKAREATLSLPIRLFKIVFTPRYFEPHKIHFYDDAGLLWFLVLGNALITLAYILIPIGLVYLVRKRRDIVFTPIFFLFAAFIVLCGLTHLMHIIIFWFPIYWLEGIILAITGIISMLTFFALLKVIFQALKLKAPKELETINAQLKAEIEQRKKIEKELLEKNESLQQLNNLMVGRELKMAELKEKISTLQKTSKE